MTYSLVAVDLSKGLLGVGVVSGSIAVGSRVPWAKAGVAAIATQAYTNPAIALWIIELMGKSLSVKEALKKALLKDGKPELRQVVAVDFKGDTVAHSGDRIPLERKELLFKGYACAGNLLRRRSVVDALCEGFSESIGSLPARIINALKAGHEAGGDARSDHSAALLIVGDKLKFSGYYDKLIDLRVDYSPNPVKELIKLYRLIRVEERV